MNASTFASDTAGVFDKEVNIAFEHYRGDRADRNYEGEPAGVPNPAGASGCGIWKLNVTRQTPQAREMNNARLVAIYHSVHAATQTTIGTKIAELIVLLKQQRPDLRAAIDLTFPGNVSRF